MMQHSVYGYIDLELKSNWDHKKNASATTIFSIEKKET